MKLNSPAEFQAANFGVTWSPDDKFIYYLKRTDRSAPYELFRLPSSGGSEERAGLRESDLRDIDIAPDGRHIVFSIGAVNEPAVWALENFQLKR